MMWYHWLLNNKSNDKFLTATELTVDQVSEGTEVFNLCCQVVSVKKLCKRTFAVRVADGSFCKTPVAHFNEDKELEVVHMDRNNFALDIYTTVQCSSDDFKFKAGIFIKIPNIQVKKFESSKSEKFLLSKIHLQHSKISILDEDDPKRKEICRRLELLKPKCQSSLRLDTDTEMTDFSNKDNFVTPDTNDEDQNCTGQVANEVDSVNPHVNVSVMQLGDHSSMSENVKEGDPVNSQMQISGDQQKDVEATGEGAEKGDCASSCNQISCAQQKDVGKISEGADEVDFISSCNSDDQQNDNKAMSEGVDEVNSVSSCNENSCSQQKDVGEMSEGADKGDSVSSLNEISSSQQKAIEAMSEGVEKVDSVSLRVHISGTQREDHNSTSEGMDEIGSASFCNLRSDARQKDLDAATEGDFDEVDSVGSLNRISGTQHEEVEATSEGVDEVDFINPHIHNQPEQHLSLAFSGTEAMRLSTIASADSTSLGCDTVGETCNRVAGEPMCKRSKLDHFLLQKKDDLNHRPAVPGKTPILRCGCVVPGTGLFMVRGCIADVDPPLSSSPLDLVCGVCSNCLNRTRYTMIDHLRPLEIKQLCHMCSLQTGTQVYLSLELFAKFRIRDERNKCKVYEAILGDKIKRKLKYCPAKEYISNPLQRMITWNRLKKLTFCKNVVFMFYLAKTNGSGFVLQDIKVLDV